MQSPKYVQFLHALEQEIQYALEDAVMGQNRSAGLVQVIKRTITEKLYQRGLRNCQISISTERGGYVVSVSIPQQGPLVEGVQLRFGQP